MGTAICLAVVLSGARAGAGQESGNADGLLHTELFLTGRNLSVAYEPLAADSPALATLLATDLGAVEVAYRLGHLNGNRSLQIGPFGPEPGDSPPSSPDHELWLMRTADGWILDARPRAPDDTEDAEDAEEPAAPVRIPLTHAPRGEPSPLTVALTPDSDDGGELSLIWGSNAWTAAFGFVELARRPRPERTSNVGRPSSLTRDSDTSGRARAATLGTRNETSLVTPDGANIRVHFHRGIGTDGDDFDRIDTIGDGDVLALTRAAVIRLRTETPLRFGDTLVPTGNLAPDFPGAYGLWLKNTASGWRLVFNNEPDSWGTQHDSAFDVVEIDLAHTEGGPLTERPLAVSLVARDDSRAGLVIHWGGHAWATEFTWTP